MAQYVSYAGVTLSLSTPELENYLNELLPIQQFKDWDAWQFAGYDLQKLPTPSLPKTPPLELGTLHWPRDATRPAWFHCVVTDSQLVAIRAAIQCETTAYPLVLQDGRTTGIITAMMYMLPPRPITQFGTIPASLPQDGWILTLTDQRFYWHWRTGSISTTPTSWASLYNSLATALGITIYYDTIDPAYGTPSSKWIGYLRPLATVLDAVAAQIGQKVVVSLDGTVSTVNWRTAEAAFLTQVEDLSLVAGGLIANEDVARYVPRALATAYADWSSGTLSAAPYITVNYLGMLGITEYNIPPNCSGIFATGYTYSDTPYDGTNASALSILGAVTADAWYGWRLQTPDMSIPGITPYTPTAWEDFIQWVAQIREDGPAIMTRVRRGQWDQFPSGTFSGDQVTPSPPVPPVHPSSDCSILLGYMRPDKCLTMTVGNGQGSCSCVPTQSVDLAWDDTLNYFTTAPNVTVTGCPPGVVTTSCPDGAPMKWVATLAGFSGGDCSPLNGTWTWTWTTGDTWVAHKSGITATLTHTTGTKFVLTFTRDSDSLDLARYTLDPFNCCATNSMVRDPAFDGCIPSPDSNISLVPATACGLGPVWTPILDICYDNCGRPTPRLRWVAGGGSSGQTITFANGGCDGGTGIFTSDDYRICTNASAAKCGPNSVTVQITCKSNCTGYVLATSPCCDGTLQIPINACLQVDIPGHTYDFYGNGPSLNIQFTNSSMVPQFSWITVVPGPGPTITVDGYDTYGITDFAVQAICQLDHTWKALISFTTYLVAYPGVYYTVQTTISGTTFSDGCNFVQGLSTPLTLDASFISGVGSDPGTVTLTIGASCNSGVTYNCTDFGCVDPGDGSGVFTGSNALANCATVCGGVVSYNCVSGACVAVSGSGGTYATLADCTAACSGSVPPQCCPAECGTTITLVIVGGGDAGTYTAPLVCMGGLNTASFTISVSVTYVFQCTGFTPPLAAFFLTRYVGGVQDGGNVTDTSSSCGPISAVFPTVGSSGSTSNTIS